MLLTTNSFCNESLAPQFIMANKDRSLSPNTAGKGGSDVSELDDKFLALWTKHLEPKMQDANNNMQKEMQDNLQKTK